MHPRQAASSAHSPHRHTSGCVNSERVRVASATRTLFIIWKGDMAADHTVVDAIVDASSALSERWSTPLLIGIFGLPGTEKTEVTRWLSLHYPLIVLSTDALRLHYQLASGPATHEAIYDVAAKLLPLNTGIVFDGMHMGRIHRTQLRQFAEHHGGQSLLLHTVAAPEVIAARLAARRDNEQETIAEGKSVISDSHFIRISRMLEEPLPEEGIWQIDTSEEHTEAITAPLQQWLAAFLVR